MEKDEDDGEEAFNEEQTILNEVQMGLTTDDLRMTTEALNAPDGVKPHGRYWKLRRGDLAMEIVVYGVEEVHEDKEDFMGSVIESLFAEFECHLSNAYLTDGTPNNEMFSESGRKPL